MEQLSFFEGSGRDYGEEVLLGIDGYDSAIIGVSDVWDSTGEKVTRGVYSASKIIEELMERDGMEYVDAVDYICFNMEGAYMGKGTPIIVWDKGPDET